jgi:predicted small secreted protein
VFVHFDEYHNKKESSFMTKRLVIGIISATLFLLAVSGCNTVHGAGEDIQSVGAAVSGN